MTLTDASSTTLLPSRALGLIGALPPALIVAGAAALGYTQAPKLGPTISGLFAPPPVVTYHAPAPVAAIPTPAPAPPVEKAPEVAATPQPPPVAPPVQHAARKPVTHVVKVVKVLRAPQPRYVYPAYRSYQPTYAPVPIPIPFIGGRGGRMFGGFGGLFGRH